MSLTVDLFWSFRSPYSYLALPKAAQLASKRPMQRYINWLHYDREQSERCCLSRA